MIRNLVLILVGLLIPSYSFSTPLNALNKNNKAHPIFFGISYKLSVPSFNNFSINETQIIYHQTTQYVAGLKNSLLLSADEVIDNIDSFDLSENYVPEYDNNVLGLSFVFGYSFEKLRIELEGFYEQFDVKDTKNHLIYNNYRHFALIRQSTLEYVTLTNNGIKSYSIILNFCYDFTKNNTHITPFSCVGIGEDIIDIFDTIRFKPAFHGKIGINYLISESVFLFIDGYYHKVIGNKYGNIPVQYPVHLFSPAHTSAIANLDIGYLGAEIGIKLFI